MNKSRRSRKLWVIVPVLLVALTAGFMLWASSGNKGQINNGSTAAPVVKATAYKQYTSKYLSLSYEDIYKEKSRVNTEPGVEQTLLRANTTYEKTLAIEVQPVPQGGVTADSGYSYRSLHPELYLDQQLTIDNSQATEWVKKDGMERTVYILHGNEYAILSFSMDRTNDVSHLPDEEATLLQSFHWK